MTNNSQSTAKSKPKKKWWRRFLYLLLALVVFLVLLVACLPFYSGLLTGYISSFASDSLGRDVSIGEFSINLITSRLFLGNLHIKDGEEEILSFKKLDVDFSILPAISGNLKIDVPRADLVGLRARLIKDESGNFNFQKRRSPQTKEKSREEDRHQRDFSPEVDGSTVDRDSTPKEKMKEDEANKEGSPGKEKPLTLPEVQLHLVVTDSDVLFEDRQQGQTLHIEGFGVDCRVQGLDNITYETEGSEISFERAGKQPLTCRLSPQVGGKASLQIKEGKPFLSLQSNTSVAVEAKGKEDLDLDGALEIDVFVDGSPEDEIKARLHVDLTPLAMQVSQQQWQLKKASGTTMSCVADISCNMGNLQQIQPSSSVSSDLQVLEQEVRDAIRECVAKLTFRLDAMDLDRNNRLKNCRLDIACNQEKIDNLLTVRLNGNVNSGSFEVASDVDLSSPHPVTDLRYDVDELPYIASLFDVLETRLEQYIPLPILEKFRFQDVSKISFDLHGGMHSRGIDWRVLKKSLVTTREVSLKLPAGRFDLGYDIEKLPGMESLAEVGENVEALKDKLAHLQRGKLAGDKKHRQLRKRLDKLDKTIGNIVQQRQKFEQLIKKLEYVPFAGSKLREAKKKLAEQDDKMEQYREQQRRQQDALQSLQKKLARRQEQIEKLQQKVDQASGGVTKQLENPFAFDFDNCTIALSIINDNPWVGKGGSAAIEKAPVSKVEYQDFSFVSEDADIPKISGWSSLDGDYRFKFELPKGAMKDLSKIPGLTEAIEKSGGVFWDPEGFHPNPFK